ncbi:hypothetical protein Glove_84g135 [Diversispora epigaea]|uniref:Uncharacterized protein n=1 Tax=Diversispora epigaea TaxID=1348612 RepID=A0A397J760_9GLOM|nr:hypothetical protein Glove_84g135 [Diversispora epigaea]
MHISCEICAPSIYNGVRPKVPDFMLNWIPECDDSSEHPTAAELYNLFLDILNKLYLNIVDNDLHSQSCYIGQYIHTLRGLHDLLEEIKSGKFSDPNLLKH